MTTYGYRAIEVPAKYGDTLRKWNIELHEVNVAKAYLERDDDYVTVIFSNFDSFSAPTIEAALAHLNHGDVEEELSEYAQIEAEFVSMKRAVDKACSNYYRAKFRGDPNAEHLGDVFDILDTALERLGDVLANHPDRPKTWIPLW